MDAQKHFGTTNLYKILEIDSDAAISEGTLMVFILITLVLSFFLLFFSVKKSFYRLALLHHPDRVPESAKAISKEKFAILHQSYVVLSDPNERKLYDEGNDIVFSTKATMTAEWERFLKPAGKQR